MSTLAIALLALTGCHEFTVVLEQASAPPLEVYLGDPIEVPVGIVATVIPYAYRDGISMDWDTPIELVPEDRRVFDITPLRREDGEWALVASEIGQSRILPWVDGRQAQPLEVRIVPQLP